MPMLPLLIQGSPISCKSSASSPERREKSNLKSKKAIIFSSIDWTRSCRNYRILSTDLSGELASAKELKTATSAAISAVRGVRQPVKKEWSFTRLRPTPPYQQQKSNEERGDFRRLMANKKSTKGLGSKEELDGFARKASTPSFGTPASDKQVLEEDMMILSVIEAYCFSTRSRQTVNLESPVLELENNNLVEIIEPEQFCVLVNESEAAPLLELEVHEEELIPVPRKINIGKKILLKGCLCVSGKAAQSP